MYYLVSDYLSLPQEPGVYQFLGKNGEVLYVGKAKNLKNRVSSYFTKSADLGEKTRVLVSQVIKIKITVVNSEVESLLLEASLIKKHNPKYNIRLTDNKSYPLIKVTTDEQIPKVLIARRIDNPKATYFGPFPNSGAMRLVLKTVRRIFPFESVKNHPKHICLYNHLRLCPCVEANPTKENVREYKKTIRYICKFLDGQTEKVIKELTKERDNAAKKEEFEKALDVQKQIDAINLITQPVVKPVDWEVNPNLKDDLRMRELEGLKTVLNQNGYSINKLERIECYDISNIQGTNATGSLVVFTNGEKDSKWYRRFKIHLSGRPNDFAMHQEMLRRRLNHPEWPTPDLIIVDGGKGQVSSDLEVLKERNLPIPLIGLAKRLETIVTYELKEVKLPDTNPSLHLIMRLRDEAHRFAITYHRKLRSKAFLETLKIS